MTISDTSSTHDPGFLRECAHAHERVLQALDDPAANSLVAVTWASAHLASVERVLHPLARGAAPDGRELVRVQAAVDRRLHLALWQLDRRLTGDVHLARIPVQVLEDDVRRTLDAHVRQEARLVEALAEVLSPEEQRDVDERLAATLLRSPTRPHPDTRHGRLTGALAFWVDGVVDRVRDGLDSRVVPTPCRTWVPRPMTRWGAYALGAPAPPAHRDPAAPQDTAGTERRG